MLCISKVLVPLHTIHIYIYIKDILEAHCYVVITSESILMSKYVAESINQLQTTDAGRFSHVGLRQLRTKLKILQCKMSYIATLTVCGL